MELDPRTRKARFGVFEVDFRSGELQKHGIRLRLQDQPFQVLALLLEHAGDLVTREELRQKLWPADTFVDFDTGLDNAIKKLRDVLSDSAEKPRYIETLPRRGYRFIARVENGNGDLPASTNGSSGEDPWTHPKWDSATESPLSRMIRQRWNGLPAKRRRIRSGLVYNSNSHSFVASLANSAR